MEGHQLRSKNEIVLESTDKNELWSLLAEQDLEDLAKFQMNGSGWTLHPIVALDIHTVGYKPLRGGTFVKLPKFLSRKEARTKAKKKNIFQSIFQKVDENEKRCILWHFVLVTLLPTGQPRLTKKFSSRSQSKTS